MTIRTAVPIISVDNRPVNPKMPSDMGQQFPTAAGDFKEI
jgi:hypothetical protein